MKSSRAYRNMFQVLDRPHRVHHLHDSKNRLVGSIAIVAGNGVYHVGVSYPAAGELPRRKVGYQIALNRARLEYAIANGLSHRTGAKSRRANLMATGTAEELSWNFNLDVDQLPISYEQREEMTHLETLVNSNTQLKKQLQDALFEIETVKRVYRDHVDNSIEVEVIQQENRNN